jgi:hypothetical protein
LASHGLQFLLIAVRPEFERLDVLRQQSDFTVELVPRCLEIKFLAGHYRGHIIVVPVFEDNFRKPDLGLTRGFRRQARHDALQPDAAQEELAFVDPRRGLVKPDQRLVQFHIIALADQQFADQAAFEMLHDLILAGGHKAAYPC